jgi:hypothetical protein
MKNSKLKALVVVAAMFATSAFATDFATDLSAVDPTDVTSFDTELTAAGAAFADMSATDPYVQNVALILQGVGDSVAWIDQVNADTSFAAIIQTGTTSTVSVAYIGQNGSGNLAVIKQ